MFHVEKPQQGFRPSLWQYWPASETSTSGSTRSLPKPTTANTLRGASSTRRPAAERAAEVPPPETPTTPQPPGQNAASPSRVAASWKPVAKMFAVAEEQPVFGGNYCKTHTVKKVMSGMRKSNRQGHADRHGKYEVIRDRSFRVQTHVSLPL